MNRAMTQTMTCAISQLIFFLEKKKKDANKKDATEKDANEKDAKEKDANEKDACKFGCRPRIGSIGPHI